MLSNYAEPAYSMFYVQLRLPIKKKERKKIKNWESKNILALPAKLLAENWPNAVINDMSDICYNSDKVI